MFPSSYFGGIFPDNFFGVYGSGSMYGSRYDTTINIAQTQLYFQFYIKGTVAFPYTWNKVETYSSYSAAVSGTSPIQTIPSSELVSVNVGLIQYLILTPSNSGVYYDKVFVTPVLGAAEVSYIAPIYVRNENYAFAPNSEPEYCHVYGFVKNEQNQVVSNALLTVTLQRPEVAGSYFIVNPTQQVLTDELGFFVIKLIRSAEYTDSINYEVEINYESVSKKYIITVPESSVVVEFNTLIITE